MLRRVPTLMKTRSPLQLPRAAGVQRHLDCFRFRERRFTHDQFRAAGLELAEMNLHQLVDHLPFAAGDAGHVDANVSGHDAQARCGMNKRDGLGTVNDVLARQAGDVRARAADHRTFDDDGLLALARQCPSRGFCPRPRCQ